jgi:hypothetical protein
MTLHSLKGMPNLFCRHISKGADRSARSLVYAVNVAIIRGCPGQGNSFCLTLAVEMSVSYLYREAVR